VQAYKISSSIMVSVSFMSMAATNEPKQVSALLVLEGEKLRTDVQQ
jgi:hypothetical protein